MQLRGEELSDFEGDCKLFFSKLNDFLVFFLFSMILLKHGVAFVESLGNGMERFITK